MDLSDCHRVLGASIDDDEEYITARYRELSKAWHPDKCGKYGICSDERKAMYTEHQREINDAYRVLKSAARKKSNGPRRSSVEVGEIDVPLADIAVGVVLLVCVVSMLRPLFQTKGTAEWSWKCVGLWLLVGIATVTLYMMQDTPHIKMLLLCVSPLYAIACYLLLRDIAKGIFSVLYGVLIVLVTNWITITLCIVGTVSAMVSLPKVSAGCLIIALFMLRSSLPSGILPLASALVVGYLYSTATYIADPYLDFCLEVLLAQAYTITTINRNLIRDPSTEKYMGMVQSCMAGQHACDYQYIQRTVSAMRESIVVSSWAYLCSCIHILPHILIVCSSLALLRTFSRSLKPTISTWSSSWGNGSITTTSSTSNVSSAPPDDRTVDALCVLFPEMSQRDLRKQLETRGGDIQALLEYLYSPTGKANRAALRRVQAKNRTSPTNREGGVRL